MKDKSARLVTYSVRFSSFSRMISLFPEVYMLFPMGAILPPDQVLSKWVHPGFIFVDSWLLCHPDIWSMLGKHRWNEGEPAFAHCVSGGWLEGCQEASFLGDPTPGPACLLPVSHARLHSALPPGLHSSLQSLGSPTSFLILDDFPILLSRHHINPSMTQLPSQINVFPLHLCYTF